MSLDAARQAQALAWLASAQDFELGDAAALPWPAEQLDAMDATHPAVQQLLDGGLSAQVLQLRAADGRLWALKRARAESRVRNADGQTAFLNELQRHAELRGAGPGIVQPLYGSLRRGWLLSPWLQGQTPDLGDARAAAALLQAAFALLRRGCFEWDYAPGNLIDDGQQVWLFDFGYCYRFDPLTQFNSAGNGVEHPEHHVVERIEARALFAALLDHAEPLAAFLRWRQLALQACSAWQAELQARGAAAFIVDDWARRLDAWAQGLAQDPERLYLEAARAAHQADLLDDLRGQSCTPRTLRRADWLIAHAPDRATREQLQSQRRQAQAWQHPT